MGGEFLDSNTESKAEHKSQLLATTAVTHGTLSQSYKHRASVLPGRKAGEKRPHRILTDKTDGRCQPNTLVSPQS